MSLFKTLLTSAATGMLPTLLTPILGKDKASQIAPSLKDALNKVQQGGYGPNSTKEDVMRAIMESGATKNDLARMNQWLNNSEIGQTLNKFVPQLTENLRSLSQEIGANIPGSGTVYSKTPTTQQARFKALPLKKR